MMNWPEYEEEPKPQRKTVLPYLMLAVLIVGIGLALWSGYVRAGDTLIYKDQQTTIRLFDRPCDAPAMLKIIKPEHVPTLKAAEGDFTLLTGEHQTFAGCWRFFEKNDQHPDLYGVIFEDADYYGIEKDKFRPEAI